MLQRGGELYERRGMLGMQSGGHCAGGSSARGTSRGVSIHSVSYASGPGYVTREARMHICAGNVVSLPGSAYRRERSIVCDRVRGRVENGDDILWE